MEECSTGAVRACVTMRRVRTFILVKCANILMSDSQLVRAYKIPLIGLPQFIQIPVSRGTGSDSHDVPEIELLWSIEGRQRRFTRIERISSYAPPPRRIYPFKGVPTYQTLRTGVESKPSKRSRKRTFDIYIREGLDYEMAMNETLQILNAETCIRAEFIIVEHTAGRQRLTDCKNIDKMVMNYLALECVYLFISPKSPQLTQKFSIAWALGYRFCGKSEQSW